MSLPVIDLSPLSHTTPTISTLNQLSESLSTALSSTGFAYLLNPPLSTAPTATTALARAFFSLPLKSKYSIAKKSACRANNNTYRGYFPIHPGADNLKEGFEIGPPEPGPQHKDPLTTIDLTEPNVWPTDIPCGLRSQAETLHRELQSLSQRLLALLATSLGKESTRFDYMHIHSISTLRLLHYPSPPSLQAGEQASLCCTPHTDSGILTLLHQDETGGLEVLCHTPNSSSPTDEEVWIPAPPLPNTLILNVGDLMARISGGRFKATMHRVRSSPGKERYSVPFFFEPGAECVVRGVDEAHEERGVVYGDHVREKMKGWVEFADGVEDGDGDVKAAGVVESLREVDV